MIDGDGTGDGAFVVSKGRFCCVRLRPACRGGLTGAIVPVNERVGLFDKALCCSLLVFIAEIDIGRDVL